MGKSLEGIKVVQLATFIAASAATRYLADHGADVIMVESSAGDPSRYTAANEGRPQGMMENTNWEYVNGGKRGVALDLKNPAGKEMLYRLLDQADVFVTNWRIPALERAGLDYETLKLRYPKLIYAICSGYGLLGPDKDLPGYDLTSFMARGGYIENLRIKGHPAPTVLPAIGDNNVGMNLALGIVTALYKARDTGLGDFVSSSLYETAIFNQSIMLLAAQYDGIARQYPIDIYGNKNPLNGTFFTSDDRILQTSMPDYNNRFAHFCEVIGRSDMVESGKFLPQTKMLAEGNLKECIDELDATFRTKTCKEWMQILQEGDIPFSLAYSWPEMLDDPQAMANGAFYELTCRNGVVRKITHTPIHLASEERGEGWAPLVGEHSAEVARELGYSEEEIAALYAGGALYTWTPEASE